MQPFRTMRTRGRRPLRAALSVAVVGAFLAPIALSFSEPAHADARPNVLIILTDDQRFDELANMPNVQSLLVAQGTTFDRYHFTTSVCCPSRAAMLSGQYNHNNKVLDNTSGAKFDSTNTLATMMTTAGYNTSYIGKYLNGYGCTKPMPEGWTDWQGLCYRVQSKYGYKIHDNGVTVAYGRTEADYQTDVLAGRAADTITEFSSSTDPFFMVLAPTAPHGPLQPPARYKTAFPNYEMPKRPNFDEADVSDKPTWVRTRPPTKTVSIDRSERKRLQMLLAVDDMVGNVVGRLQSTGELDNTIIMFASDNGFMRGEHRIPTGKDHFYTESIQGPFVMRGPGIPVGATNHALVGNVDLAPYIVARAGATPTIAFDGLDFHATFSDPLALENRVYLHRRPAWDSTFPVPQADGLTTEDGLRYSRFANGVEELYDLIADPYELTNVAGSPAYATERAELSTMLTTLKTCAAASCHVTYNRKPVASFTTADAGGGTIDVDGTTSHDPGGTIASWAWSFGDGGTATGALASHTYATDGTYTITLTVTDDDGRTATTTRSVTVDANEPPVPSFTTSTSERTVDVDGSASSDPDGTVADWAWDFGDGATATGALASHTYATDGTYTITLTVTDDLGRTASISQSVTVDGNDPPTAAFGHTETGLQVDVDGSASSDPDGTVADWAWDFGDGATASGALASHTYAAPGSYTVTLTVTDDLGAQATTTETVVVA